MSGPICIKNVRPKERFERTHVLCIKKLFPALMTEDQTRFVIRFVREDVKVFKEKKKNE